MIKAGSISRKAASRLYNIPKTTILDKLAGRVPLKARSGPSPVLNQEEKTILARYIKHMSQIGSLLTVRQLQLQVKSILDKDNRNTVFKENLPGTLD